MAEISPSEKKTFLPNVKPEAVLIGFAFSFSKVIATGNHEFAVTNFLYFYQKAATK